MKQLLEGTMTAYFLFKIEFHIVTKEKYQNLDLQREGVKKCAV